MNMWGRLLLSLLVLTVGMAGVSFSQPEWLWHASGLAGAEASFTKERETEARLERRLEIVQRRLEVKRKIIRELLAGRITLFRAAALFGDVNESPEDCRDAYRLVTEGQSDGEKLCRQVIAWAKEALARHVSAGPHLLIEQLEKQLEAHMAANGGVVVLPEEGEQG
jgi:hypothetical protein